MAIMRNDRGNAIYPVGRNFVNEDASFVVGESPRVLDVNDTLGRNGNRGYINVYGAGDLLVEISHSETQAGVPQYTTQFTLRNSDNFDLTGWDLDTIRLTWSADTAYRVHCW